MISEGDYTELKASPPNKMKNNVHDVLNQQVNVIGKLNV